MSPDPDPTVLDLGEAVYDGDGNELGTVRGFDEDGFYVTTRDDIAALSVEHSRSGGAFGEAELAWRCATCGSMGDIDDLPDECPDCGAPKEEIYYWIED